MVNNAMGPGEVTGMLVAQGRLQPFCQEKAGMDNLSELGEQGKRRRPRPGKGRLILCPPQLMASLCVCAVVFLHEKIVFQLSFLLAFFPPFLSFFFLPPSFPSALSFLLCSLNFRNACSQTVHKHLRRTERELERV